LAERVENFALADEGGAVVAVNKLAPGEFTAAKPATRFSYDLKLDAPAFVTDAAHVSWLNSDRGLLMPADFLPQPLAGAKVELNMPAGNLWSAETRGSTVVLLSGRMPSKLAAKAQLDGSLTHELFHLWVPNGLTLDGEYDWFYEGFTNYEALRVGMRRGQLTFQDYL